jgi:hypothetical protein
VKDAVSFIGKFEAAVAHYAERYQVDAVLAAISIARHSGIWQSHILQLR